jgi:hypothetical protein
VTTVRSDQVDPPALAINFSKVGAVEVRGLLLSDVFPIPLNQQAEFRRIVQDFDWEDYYLTNVRSSRVRDFALQDLRDKFALQTCLDAELGF